eukprot:UN06440
MQQKVLYSEEAKQAEEKKKAEKAKKARSTLFLSHRKTRLKTE